MIENAWLIPVLPAVAFMLIVFVTRKFRALSAATAITAMAISFIMSVGVLWEVIQQGITMEHPREIAVPWLKIPESILTKELLIEAGLLIDPLTAVMLIVVTTVALLVEIYSVGYMHGEKGYSVFFSYLSLFSTSMLGLVVANNYFQMFFFWELVGLCSYLLIGFYFHKDSAAQANKKAFITNRWGDFGFMLGIFFLFLAFNTFNFGELSEAFHGYENVGFLTLAGLLVFIGPVAKSAQFPLHVWLPDAMEGPTPVSALIHAATMVAAGVYLVARGYILFASSETTALVIAYVGGFSALIAATIALAQDDCKRILAFSTMSQLGYMVMAMGVGSLTAGMFHLTTHAFFKALMFLAAGSIIHATHEQNIFKMGGLRKRMPITTWTMVIGALALAGIFPLAGFWSKDEILLAAHDNGFTGLYILGSVVAFMTAFYMFRMIFTVFWGEEPEGQHAHESPPSMTVPLIVLAVLSVVSGYALVKYGFASFVYFHEPHHVEPNIVIMVVSNILAIAGISLAWLIYGKKVISAEAIANKYRAIHTLLYRKFYIDDLYIWLFDHVMLAFSKAFNWHDRHVVDGVFDGIGDLTRAAGAKLRFIHTGSLQNYALVIFAAVVLIMLWMAAPAIGGI